ncbi:MAG TPA: hypothetical protein PK743_13170 [Luteimonas sp.]|nr:hypothetical protein [Luteimonas sp.]HRP73569.1 hypothetical protein [Luteimonas sp.]
MNKPAPPVLRFHPRLWAALVHLLLLAGVFVLFLGRKPGMFRVQAIVDRVPDFYTHVFNFALSYLLLAGIGYLWVLMGVHLRHVAWAALALAVANLAYEWWLPLLNTRDPVDALYGIVGTACAFAWLWLVVRFGLRPAPPASG